MMGTGNKLTGHGVDGLLWVAELPGKQTKRHSRLGRQIGSFNFGDETAHSVNALWSTMPNSPRCARP